jgi:hypothetical protein
LLLQLALYFLWYALIVKKVLESCFMGYLLAIYKGVGIAVVMAITIYINRKYFIEYEVATALCLQLLLGMFVYLTLSIILRKNEWTRMFVIKTGINND